MLTNLLLDDQDTAAFAEHLAVAVAVEGPARFFRLTIAKRAQTGCDETCHSVFC